MTEVEAKARISLLVDASTAPQLSSRDLDDLVAACRLADSEDRAPDDEEWEPTFDINLGVAMGFEIKMARSADHHVVTVGGLFVSARQVFDNC